MTLSKLKFGHILFRSVRYKQKRDGATGYYVTWDFLVVYGVPNKCGCYQLFFAVKYI